MKRTRRYEANPAVDGVNHCSKCIAPIKQNHVAVVDRYYKDGASKPYQTRRYCNEFCAPRRTRGDT